VMIPLGAQAESELTVYGHVHNALVSKSYEGDTESTVDVDSMASRFGFRANSDLGNGLTGHALLELQVNDTDSSGGTGLNTRHGYVGVSGGVGKVTIGQQGGAFYGSVAVDNSIWEGGIGGHPSSRTSNTIKYSNAVGPLSLQLDLRQNDSGDGSPQGNGGALGLSAALTDSITLGFAADMDDNDGVDTNHIGVSGMVNLGPVWGSLSWVNKEVTSDTGATTTDQDSTQLWLGVPVSDSTEAVFGYGQTDQGDNQPTPTATSFGIKHNLGGGLTLWYEGQVNEDDDDASLMKTYEAVHRLALRYIF